MYFVAVKVKISTFVIPDIQERVKRFKFSKKGQYNHVHCIYRDQYFREQWWLIREQWWLIKGAVVAH